MSIGALYTELLQALESLQDVTDPALAAAVHEGLALSAIALGKLTQDPSEQTAMQSAALGHYADVRSSRTR